MKFSSTLRVVMASLGLVSGITLTATPSEAQFTYDVTITNITKGQTFTPLQVVAHSASIALFELGEPASTELEAVAEAGDRAPLQALLGTLGSAVGGTGEGDGLLGPGASVTIQVEGGPGTRRISVISMLIPTNDTFIAVDSLRAPRRLGGRRTTLALAYDSGTEANDQDCTNIPGPRCMGEGVSAADGSDEGFVHISNGFHTLPDDGMGGEILGPFTYDWRNPVARIVVERVN